MLIGFLLAVGTLNVATAADRVTPINRVVNQVNVRNAPTTDGSHVVGKLAPGDLAVLLEDVPQWLRVRLSSGTEGFVSKRWVRVITGAEPLAADAPTPFTLHVIDVGNGDGILLDMGEREILIDGGMYRNPFEPYLLDNGLLQAPIELAIVTHADADHWKGMQHLLANSGASVLEFWEPGYDRSCKPLRTYDEFVEQMRVRVTTDRFLRPLGRFRPNVSASATSTPTSFRHPDIEGVEFFLLHSDDAPLDTDCAFRINDASIVLKVVVGGISILLTGDANGKRRNDDPSVDPISVEAKLLALEHRFPGILRADIAKVSHHGSETASTQDFIDAVQPTFALISASTGHHLPRPKVVERWEGSGAIVLQTDVSRHRGDDTILCVGPGDGSVDCNYLDQFEE